MKIEPHDLYKYREVFEIIERVNGAIKKTRSTGLYVPADWPNPNPHMWLTASVSTALLKSKTALELPVLPDHPLFQGDLT